MLVMAHDTLRHLDEEDIERYSMGSISEDESAGWEEHLLICESCRRRVAANDAMVRAMRNASTILRQEVLPGRRGPLGWRLGLLAAAAVVVVALVVRATWAPGTQQVAITLVAMRGGDLAAHAPAGAALALHPDVTGLTPASFYELRVVDAAGREVWRGSTPGAPVRPLRPGAYFVRLYTGGKLVREYGLLVQ